jgi:hypothetical protein
MGAIGSAVLLSSVVSVDARQQDGDTQSSKDEGWQVYRNEAAGYAIDYPADWTVDERNSPDGIVVTTFAPPGGEASIEVQSGGSRPPVGPSLDVPNVRCRPTVVGGLSGSQCFDTIDFTTILTLSRQGRTFTLVASGKRLDPGAYQTLVASFRLLDDPSVPA